MTRSIHRRGYRVELRPPRSSDADEYIRLNRQSRTFYVGLASPPYTHTEYRQLLAQAGQPAFAPFLIYLREDAASIGGVELSQIVRGKFHSAYLGYQIGAPFARRGYMGEALRLLLSNRFDEFKLHRVEANVQPENAASIRLLRRLGFAREGFSRRYLKIGGRWRDHERWAILAEDWCASHSVHEGKGPNKALQMTARWLVIRKGVES